MEIALLFTLWGSYKNFFSSCNQQFHVINKPRSSYLLDEGNLLHVAAQVKHTAVCIGRNGFGGEYQEEIKANLEKLYLSVGVSGVQDL
jgi:hypothetical protein